MKISYSTTPNIISYIKEHNNKLLDTEMEATKSGCNCRGGVKNCPLSNTIPDL